MTYAIRFEWPEGQTAYAGDYKGAAGWADTLRTALLFDDADSAQVFLSNAYGENTRKYGRVVAIKDGGVA